MMQVMLLISVIFCNFCRSVIFSRIYVKYCKMRTATDRNHIPSWTIWSSNFPELCLGWGICVSYSLSASRRTDLEQQNIECICFYILDLTCDILLCCTYWPQILIIHFENTLYISSSIDKASDKSNKLLIIGDLN